MLLPDPDMMVVELVPEHCQTSMSPEGRYFSSQHGSSFISGPPIRLQHFTLAKDNPEWVPLHPRLVNMKPRRIRYIAAYRRPSPPTRIRPYDLWPPRSRTQPPARRVRDMRWLVELVGKPLMRRLYRLPLDAKPYAITWLSQRLPTFTQLFQDAPMLAVLVANDPGYGPRAAGMDEYLDYCEKSTLRPRRGLAEEQGLPPEAAKGLSKVTLAGCDPCHRQGLTESLQDSLALRRFNHSTLIGPDGIQVFATPRMAERVSGSFLRRLERFDRHHLRPVFAPMLEYLLELFEAGDEVDRRRVFSSPEQLANAYFEASERIGSRSLRHLRSAAFPQAPFEDTDFLHQIRTGRQLIEEARAMNHCCALPDFAAALEQGRFYLYSGGGFGLQRCTVAIGDSGLAEGEPRHAIFQVVGEGNSKISPASHKVLYDWARETDDLVWGVEPTSRAAVQLELPGLG